MALVLSRLSLAALCGLGIYTIQVFARTNDLFNMMSVFQQKLVLPDGLTSYDPHFTSVKPIDDLLGYLLMFFWTIIDGGHPGLSLVNFAFAGQTVATWTLTMLEGVRTGNSWKAISFTAFYGMACQLLSIGIVAPAYLLIHTLTSPLASNPTLQTLTPRSTAALTVIPAVVTLGFIFPTALMSIPAPDLIPLHIKLQTHNLWQVFPVVCSVLHFILSTIWPYNPPTTPKTTISNLRLVYKFALTFAVPAHIASTTLSVSSCLFPTLFSPDVVGLLHPMNVFVPGREAFLGVKARSIAEGALWFIQWDYALSGSAYLVWAVMSRQQGRRYAGEKTGFGVGGLVKVGIRTAVLGPVGAAVAYVWERDELAFEKGEGMGRKKVQ